MHGAIISSWSKPWGKPHEATGIHRPCRRRNGGVDKHHHDDFRIIMKVPDDARQKAAFLAQFRVQEQGGYIEVRLPIAKVPKQLQVKWTDSPGGGRK